MTERHIILNAYPLIDCGPTGFTVSIDLSGKSPSKRTAINTVADCKTALAAFAAELEPLGKPLHLSVLFDKRSGRKPAGFDKASSSRELQCHVNAHLAPQRSPWAPFDTHEIQLSSPRFIPRAFSCPETFHELVHPLRLQRRAKAKLSLTGAQTPQSACRRARL